MDVTVNQFGRQLLTLCKATYLRIVNGRHTDDPDGSITFYNSNGCSLIDYVLTEVSNFPNILSFSSGIFNTFSDHAPVFISLKVMNNVCSVDETKNVDEQHVRFKWKDDNTDIIRKSLQDTIPGLLRLCELNDLSSISVDSCVEHFTSRLNELILPMCTDTCPLVRFMRRTNLGSIELVHYYIKSIRMLFVFLTDQNLKKIV